MVLIGLIGYKQSGKDTFADYLVCHHNFKKEAFAEPVKEVCRIMFHLKYEQMNDPILKETIDERWGISPRQMMQKVGTDTIRHAWGDDFWIKNMGMRVGNHNDNSIVVSDVRFPNEAQWVKDNGGVLIRIMDSREHSDTHSSETLQASIKEDFLIFNKKDGIEKFHQQINKLIEKINRKNDLRICL